MRWKRSRRRGVSAARIALLVVLLGATAAYLLWRERPLPPPSFPVGSERIATPAFDISDPRVFAVLRRLRNEPQHAVHGQWFGDACADRSPILGDEAYLLTRLPPGHHRSPVTRTLVRLHAGGDATFEIERLENGRTVRLRTTRPRGAEAFRTMLLDGGYPALPPAAELPVTGLPVDVALQSCRDGRYYGVIRNGHTAPLDKLADAIDVFASESAAR